MKSRVFSFPLVALSLFSQSCKCSPTTDKGFELGRSLLQRQDKSADVDFRTTGSIQGNFSFLPSIPRTASDLWTAIQAISSDTLFAYITNETVFSEAIAGGVQGLRKSQNELFTNNGMSNAQAQQNATSKRSPTSVAPPRDPVLIDQQGYEAVFYNYRSAGTRIPTITAAQVCEYVFASLIANMEKRGLDVQSNVAGNSFQMQGPVPLSIHGSRTPWTLSFLYTKGESNTYEDVLRGIHAFGLWLNEFGPIMQTPVAPGTSYDISKDGVRKGGGHWNWMLNVV